MEKSELKGKSNKELFSLLKEKENEWKIAKGYLIALYDKWMDVEKDYNKISEEINRRKSS